MIMFRSRCRLQHKSAWRMRATGQRWMFSGLRCQELETFCQKSNHLKNFKSMHLASSSAKTTCMASILVITKTYILIGL